MSVHKQSKVRNGKLENPESRISPEFRWNFSVCFSFTVIVFCVFIFHTPTISEDTPKISEDSLNIYMFSFKLNDFLIEID